jgi:colanic acid/amylovoran biosynthesis glycosyltransferase
VHGESRKRICLGLNPLLGRAAVNLKLASIASTLAKPIQQDWIICHFGPNGVLANKLKRIGVLNGKVATIFHGSDISSYAALKRYSKEYRQLFCHSELLLPISELWRDRLIALGCSPQKVVVHRMGVDLAHFTFKLKAHGELAEYANKDDSKPALKVFTVARFTEKKGLMYAIESLLHLPNDIKITYQIAGFGELEDDLRALVKKLQLSERVTFLGPLNANEVKLHMLSADVFLQPSVVAKNGDMEGVPVAIMEAMAVGTPVIATNHSGIPELITDKQEGLLVPEKSPIAIAEALLVLFNSEELRQSMALLARKRIERSANVKVLNQQLIQLLTQKR